MMKKEEKDKYEAPLTRRTQVDLENGFMKASVFDPEADQDKGVSIEGHEVGNEGVYSSWDTPDPTNARSF